MDSTADVATPTATTPLPSVPAERFRALADRFTTMLDAVPDDGWSAPTPCEAWTVRDLARHVVDTQGIFLGTVGRSLVDAARDDDVRRAWQAARDQVQGDLDDPARAEEEFDGYFGRTTFAESIDQFVSFDLVVHRWDLARGLGVDERLSADEIAFVWRATELYGDTIRSEGICEQPVAVPEGADEQARLLAYLGRRA